MEQVGAISVGEWNSLNEMCSEEAEFMAQLLGNCSLPDDQVLGNANFPASSSSTLWLAGVNEAAMYSSDESSMLFPFLSHEEMSNYPSDLSHNIFVTNNNMMTMDYCMMEDKNYSCRVVVGDDDHVLNLQDVSKDDSRESNKNMSEDGLHGKNLESKKRSRIPGEAIPVRNKRSVKLNKRPKGDEDYNNNSNGVVLYSSSCCSEDDSNEINGLSSSSNSKGSRALNVNGKKRAGRGSATDPQSLYARKRRERINERLRILQKLVPNGTKVDISTMLEEAVQYVKFLQLQIKLLSSDDMWMYAPIAYNGMDIGLDLKISAPKPQS